MNHVELLRNYLVFTFSICLLEVSNFILAVNFLQIVAVVDLGFVFVDIGLQCRHVVRHTKKDAAGVKEIDINALDGDENNHAKVG